VKGDRERPCLLLTNDDGYDAPGLTALVEAVEPLGDVVVVAPDRERSGAGHALTLGGRFASGGWLPGGTASTGRRPTAFTWGCST